MKANQQSIASSLPQLAPMTTSQPGRPESKERNVAIPDPGGPLKANGQVTPNPHPRKKAPFVIAVAVIASVLAWTLYHRSRPAAPPPAGGPGSVMAVPVVVGTVSNQSMPIFLDGLGTVQAFNTVTVRARVDGQLQKVTFTEGQEIKRGDVLAELDAAPYRAALDQAEAKKSQDQVQLANARVDLQRYADLLQSDGVTQQVFDTQKALVSQFEAAINADQAAVESAKVNLDYATIRSPIDGRVGIRQVDAGNIIHANDVGGLVVVTQLRPISVVFTLPEQSLGKLQDHQPDGTNIYLVLAVSRDNTKVLAEGRLAVIDNQIDTTTGTIKLKATFANENLRLWPGQFVNTRLLLMTRRDCAVIPASAVQRGPEGAFAFVIQDDQTVMMRSLKVAQIETGQALIDEGLKPGERIVVDGQYKLQPGTLVKPASPAGTTNRESAAARSGQSRSDKKP